MKNKSESEARSLLGKDDLIGSLKVAGIFDLCQFLMLNRKSGTLTLFRRGGTSRLYFINGQIINASQEPEGKQGREIALQTLRIDRGGFRFREQNPSTSHLIKDVTQNLLLDAARLIDESMLDGGKDPGDTTTGSLEEEVLHKQEVGEEVRKLFTMIEEEVASEGEAPPN